MSGVLALLDAPQPAAVAKGLVALALLTRACLRFLAQALRARLLPQVPHAPTRFIASPSTTAATCACCPGCWSLVAATLCKTRAPLSRAGACTACHRGSLANTLACATTPRCRTACHQS